MAPHIAVLMTCHNRVHQTLRCLEALFSQKGIESFTVRVYLVDDGSTDNTGATVKHRFPEVEILQGDGFLFWNRGMFRAFQAALDVGYDYYLWLNDDTIMHNDALLTLIDTHRLLTRAGHSTTIIAGSTIDTKNGSLSYGGYRRAGLLSPLQLSLTPPSEEPTRCVTFCGNCVLISRAVSDIVGNIDPIFRHRWGDVDYGLRAARNGGQCWIAPGYLADCADNPETNRHHDRALSLRDRITALNSVKGLGKDDWLLFVRRHGGITWPLMWARPYLRLIYDTIAQSIKL